MRLSIIVTVYNAEAYIEECVQSFYHQDIPLDEYEVIIVDNASLDGSMRIVDRLLLKYENLRVVVLPVNRCAGGGRNAGLRVAKGDYILFVDADDYLYPNVLSFLLHRATQDDLDILHFDHDILLDKTLVVTSNTNNTSIMPGSELLFKCDFPWTRHIVVWRKLFKKDFLIQNHLFFIEDILFDDDVFVFQTYAIAQRTQHLSFKVSVYRTYENSTSHQRESVALVKCLMTQATYLQPLIDQCKSMALNARFLSSIEQLLKYNLSQSFHCYRFFSGVEKQRVRRIIKELINRKMIHYCSKKEFIKFIVGF